MTLLVIVLLGCVAGCSDRKPEAVVGPGTAAEVHAAVRAAASAKDYGALYDLLDRGSRWSVMSTHKNLKLTCGLVRTHYPTRRRPRELERCRAAARAATPRAFFAGLSQDQRLRKFVAALPVKPAAAGSALCQDHGRHRYCGLRAELSRRKVKSARDLALTRENAEGYQSRRP